MLESLALEGYWFPRYFQGHDDTQRLCDSDMTPGMVYASPESAYVRLLKPFLEKKKRLGVDKWGRDDTHVKHVYEPLLKHIKEEIPEKFQRKRYPQVWGLEGHVNRVLRETLISELLTYEFASYFEGKSMDELDELAASFKFENCVKRDGLNEILKADAGISQ
jgi:hypothetical protein